MRMPGVFFVASPNISHTVVRPPLGIVLHIAEGTYTGTVGWEHDPKSQISSHFVVSKQGEITQCVDTDDEAWCQKAGNPAWISIENEGFTPDALTDDQIEAVARIYAWLHTVYGIPVQVCDDPINGQGLAYHGLGAAHGVDWGHPECPGPAIVAQRPQIVARTLARLQPPTPKKDDEMVLFLKGSTPAVYMWSGGKLVPIDNPTSLAALQKATGVSAVTVVDDAEIAAFKNA